MVPVKRPGAYKGVYYGSKETAIKASTKSAQVRFDQLLKARESRENRDISQREVMRKTGLPGHLINRLNKRTLQELPLYAIVPLMEYFSLKEPGELFEIIDIQEQQ